MNGWWISPTGEIIPIINHYHYIKANPERFGFTQENLKTTPLTTRKEDRRHFIIEALMKGWILVKEHKGYKTYEFWRRYDWIMERINKFLIFMKVYPNDSIILSEFFCNKIVPLKSIDLLSKDDII
jgi:hypothetical protein